MPTRRGRATKAELREEVRRLREVGAQLANAAFNLRQKHTLSDDDRATLDELRRKWDAVQRSEKTR